MKKLFLILGVWLCAVHVFGAAAVNYTNSVPNQQVRTNLTTQNFYVNGHVNALAVPLSGNTDIDTSLGSVFSDTLAADRVVTFSNTADGRWWTVIFTNGASWTVTWPIGVSWRQGSPPTMDTGASVVNFFTFEQQGGVIFGDVSQQTPAILNSLASLANAAGVLNNDGAGNLSWSGTAGTATGWTKTTDGSQLTNSIGNTATLTVDGANGNLGLRNGATPQLFRIYNTYTDASNNEKLALTWQSGQAYIQTLSSGSGVARPLFLTSGTNLFLGAAQAVQWAFDTNGYFAPLTNNVMDIGTSARAVRTLYVTTNNVDTLVVTNTATMATLNVTTLTATNWVLPLASTNVLVGSGYSTNPVVATHAMWTNTAGIFTGSTNAYLNAAGAIGKLNQYKYLTLVTPTYGDGSGAIPQTNDYTAATFMHYVFSGSAETNVNWVVYELSVPPDIDTAKDMTAVFAFVSGGTDADDVTFHVTYALGAAGTALPTGTGISTSPIAITTTPTTPASGDVQQSAETTLTGWAASMTAGTPLYIRVARLNNNNDDTARDLYLRIKYASTQ